MEEQPATASIQESPQETPTPTDIEQPEERVEEGVQLGEDTQLEEDGRRIGKLRERLEQGIAEVNALRTQIEEDTSRVDELIR